jgi:hypothetical protein
MQKKSVLKKLKTVRTAGVKSSKINGLPRWPVRMMGCLAPGKGFIFMKNVLIFRAWWRGGRDFPRNMSRGRVAGQRGGRPK